MSFLWKDYINTLKGKRHRMTNQREKWIASDGLTHLHPGMLVIGRTKSCETWHVDVFSHTVQHFNKCTYVCVGCDWTECIPLKNHEFLVGTNMPIPQKIRSFTWGDIVIVWTNENKKYKGIFVCEEGLTEYRYHVLLENERKISVWKNCMLA